MPCRELDVLHLPSTGETDTLFVCASSFEDRCRRVPLLLRGSGYVCKYSVMLNYHQTKRENVHLFNREKIGAALTEISEHKPCIPVDCDRLDPLGGINRLTASLSDHKVNECGGGITVDISTLTKQYILVLLRQLEQMFPSRRVRLLYTEPAQYGRGSFRRMTYGVAETVTVPGYEGERSFGGRTALVVFLGYESHRTMAAVEACEPNLIVAVIAEPPFYPGWDVYSIRAHADLLAMPGVLKVRMPARDPGAVRIGLERLWAQVHPNHQNFYVSPVGTKLQTVGIYEFCRDHSCVRVFYPIPKGYLESYYTTGYGKTWTYDLPAQPQ